MKKFHDVEIYSGRVLATTGSRLEIGARVKFLMEIFSDLADCARCREPLAVIFAEEEESTVREVFSKLSHFKTTPAFSIVESKSLLIESILCVEPLLFRPCQSELSAGETETDGNVQDLKW